MKNNFQLDHRNRNELSPLNVTPLLNILEVGLFNSLLPNPFHATDQTQFDNNYFLMGTMWRVYKCKYVYL